MAAQGSAWEVLSRVVVTVIWLDQRTSRNLVASPEVTRDAVELHEKLVEMPAPVGQGTHAVDSFESDFGGKHWTEAVLPEPDGFVTDLDATLMQQVLDVAQRQRVTNVEYHGQVDNSELIEELGGLGHRRKLGGQSGTFKKLGLTLPPCYQ